MPGIYSLKGTVKHYDWGGFDFIPHLLNEENASHIPFAEYWLGTHPLGMGMVQSGDEEPQPLSQVVPSLSFLLKAQDVRKMLSIQVHPSKESAEIEFDRENAAGIPLNAPHRNYKDDNHKPEMLVAQSDFWLLHGFKPPEELIYTLLNVVELRPLLEKYNSGGYEGLYRYVMEMPQEEVNRLLDPLVQNLGVIYEIEQPDKTDEDYWAAKAAAEFTRDRNIDRGIFSIYLLNIVHLKKGEGLFQSAGLPHAYLEGQCVEVMANSDNVLRGGLTIKHIDITELMKHVRFEATYPAILSGEPTTDVDLYYPAPVTDFRLSAFDLEAGQEAAFHVDNPQVLLLTEGNAVIMQDGRSVELKPGSPSALLLPGQPVSLLARSKSIIFRASGENA